MVKPRFFLKKIENLVEAGELVKAQKEVGLALRQFPSHKRLLLLASDLYRSSGDHSSSLVCANHLIAQYPEQWHGYARAAQDLIATQDLSQARVRIEQGLEVCPLQKQLLLMGSDIYRALNDRTASLMCADRLMAQYPQDAHGYERAVQDLVVAQSWNEAQRRVVSALERFPNNKNLLLFASDIYRALGDQNNSLNYAERLIAHCPEQWYGYARAAQICLVSQRLNQAKDRVQAGLKTCPNQKKLLVIAIDVFLARGDLDQAWIYAELLIAHHPAGWRGYGKCEPRETILMDSLQHISELEFAKLAARLGDKIYSSGIHGAYSFYQIKRQPLKCFQPRCIKIDRIEDVYFPDLDVLQKLCSSSPDLLEVTSDSLRQSLRHNASLLVFDDCVLTSAPGVHSSSGLPYLGSLISRGKCAKYSQFPTGFHSPLDDSLLLGGRKKIEMAIYLQFAEFVHFGHMLTETISSVSYFLFLRCFSRRLPESVPIIIPPQSTDAIQQSCIRRLSAILDIDESRFIVKGDQVLEVKYLISSAPTLVLHDFVSPRHSFAARCYANALDQPSGTVGLSAGELRYSKVYISRSRLNSKQRLFCQEEELQGELMSMGWYIFHPQEHSLSDQIEIYSNASIISGCEGSALHVLYCVGDVSLEKVVVLSRGRAKDFAMQFKAQGLHCDVIQCLDFALDCRKVGANRNVVLRQGVSVSDVASAIDSP